MTSIDPSNRQRRQVRHLTQSPALFYAGNGGRFLLLAVGGFLAVRLALALLHLG